MTFYSSHKQDKFLEDCVFKGLKNGVFVDVGAHDGISINNTLYFEETNQWTGINVEPIPEVYNRLLKNRPNSININCAVSNNDGTAQFVLNKGYTEMISGLKETFDPRHVNRLKNEIHRHGGTTQIINVDTKRLETIFDEHNIKRVNYLSIDVEGAEFEVLEQMIAEKTLGMIDTIIVEWHPTMRKNVTRPPEDFIAIFRSLNIRYIAWQ
jgi:FkbM family methyltransferase